MKRLALLSSLVILILVPSTALGGTAATYSATWAGQTNTVSGTGAAVAEVRIDVTCPVGETFAGRVNVRSPGETYFMGRISGECQGSAVEVATTQHVTREIPCLQTYAVSGQVQFSSGVTRAIPKVVDQFCAD